MNDRILDIDHLMISVSDSQAAGETFRRLGFTLTPRSILPGMSNRLICFPPDSEDRCNFIEFLALDDPSLAPSIMSDVLLPAERPVSMVTVSSDVAASVARLQSLGLDVPAPVRFKRDWKLPGGETISPEFLVSIPRFGQAPLYWNVVEYLTPEHYRRPEFTTHPNGATSFLAVLAVAADPVATAAHYATMWSADITAEADGSVTVGLDHVSLRLLPPAAADRAYPGISTGLCNGAARYLGFTIGVADMAILRRVLRGAGITHRDDGEEASLWIPPSEVHGCVVEFRGAAPS